MAGWARRQSPPIQGSSLSSRLVTQDLEPWASLTSQSFSQTPKAGIQPSCPPWSPAQQLSTPAWIPLTLTHSPWAWHLEEVGLPLTVDAGEGSINGALDTPDILDELGVPRPHCMFIQLIAVLP